MELTPEQKKALEDQKAQCPFCQIISGKIPSKKVYEDDLIIAILDINPSSKGHVLLMPKEHYPIMPLIPSETFKRMFSRIKEIDACIKKAMLCKETAIFIANGGVAGQQAVHFMLHIIPKEGSSSTDVPSNTSADGEREEVIEKAGRILNAMLLKNLSALDYIKAPEGAQQEAGGLPQDITKDQLMQMIETNPQIKVLMLTKPEEFKQMVPQHPQLSQIFTKFNIDEIIQELKNKNRPKEPGKLDVRGALK